jgi:hypothetical protein
MATATRRTTKKGEARYLVQVRLKGCPPTTATFSTKADARDWVRLAEGQLKLGQQYT